LRYAGAQEDFILFIFFVIKTKIKIYQRAGIAHRRELIGNVALPLA
jgi:hypothetical protein